MKQSEKLIDLALCRVPQKEILCLLTRERKLLELLKADSVAQTHRVTGTGNLRCSGGTDGGQLLDFQNQLVGG